MNEPEIPLLNVGPRPESIERVLMSLVNHKFTLVMRGSVSSSEEFQLDAYAREFEHWNRKG